MDPFDQALIRLALEVDRLMPGYVDAYIGPPELRAEVQAEPRKETGALLEALERLRGNIPVTTHQRRAYLTALLRGIDCTLRKLNGEQFDYLTEVELLYDIEAQYIDEALFEDALRMLDNALPGTGKLIDRFNERRKRYELNIAQVLPLLDIARKETRQRTGQIIELVDGDDLQIRLTNNQPWGAYNWYKGNGQSLIEFNTDIPVSALSLISTFAHEGYPGHAFEHEAHQRVLHPARHRVMLLHIVGRPAGGRRRMPAAIALHVQPDRPVGALGRLVDRPIAAMT